MPEFKSKWLDSVQNAPRSVTSKTSETTFDGFDGKAPSAFIPKKGDRLNTPDGYGKCWETYPSQSRIGILLDDEKVWPRFYDLKIIKNLQGVKK